MEWLEESIGRLLLEKERNARNNGNGNGSEAGGDDGGHRSNCCVTFTDASPDLERAVGSSSGNCCVSFKSGGEKTYERERQLRRMIVGCFCFFVAVVGITVISSMGKVRTVVVSAEEGM